MAFTIDIGYTTDNTYTVNKSYTVVKRGVSISPLSNINTLNPVFVVNYDSSLLNCNYVIASFLGRKYYCTVSVDTAQKIYLTCSVDYLNSFDLSGCDITVTRNGGLGAPTEIPDTKLPVIPNRKDLDSITVFNKELNSNLANDPRATNYLVITAGGAT